MRWSARVYTPMNEWSVRWLMNARRWPSGDHVGLAFCPNALNSGPAAAGAAGAFGRGRATGTAWIWPWLANATHLPSGESSAVPVSSASFQGSPPAVRAAHTARSPPRGSLVGLAIQPSRFGAWPRM